ncbi:MAG TPA: molybdenum cofactor guanylyltransferase [Rectinemataceae bacterium]|nr:molybdenum cofactor guanylyltransferase [Rectinemataceae bacterium]
METFGSAAVLAGGEGRRMRGLDKLAIELGGERVAGRIVGTLRLRFDDLIVVTSRPEAFAGLGVRTLRDTIPGCGPLGGLHAALAASRSEWLYLTACDMPWQSLEWIDLLEARIEERGEAEGPGASDEGGGPGERCLGRRLAAFARSGSHLEPFSAFYSRAASGLLARALRGCPEGKAPSIQALFRGAAFIGVGEEERAGLALAPSLFRSINTPEELAAARAGLDGSARKKF